LRKRSEPVRLRLSRKAGFNLQSLSRKTNGLDAVNVSRPSRWGNPYKVQELGRAKAMALFERYAILRLDPAPLRGKNLACWCAPDERCHADILLKLANRFPE
jgi:hypothetical protein